MQPSKQIKGLAWVHNLGNRIAQTNLISVFVDVVSDGFRNDETSSGVGRRFVVATH
jgi:hypothetical protein